MIADYGVEKPADEQLPGVCVVPIHGVGDPVLGSIEADVDYLLQGLRPSLGDVVVAEFNWNQYVNPVAPRKGRHRHVYYEAMRELAVLSGRVASADVAATAHRSPLAAKLARTSQSFLLLIDTALVLLAISVFLLVPLCNLAILSFVGDETYIAQSTRQILHVAQFIWSGMLAAGSLTLILAGLVAALDRSTRQLRIAIRQVLLAAVRVPLLTALVLVVPAWSYLLTPQALPILFFATPLAVSVLSIHTPLLDFLGIDLVPPFLANVDVSGFQFFFLLLGVALLYLAALAILARACSPAVKIVSDIARYIGDPAYRRDIQQRLTRHVGNLQALHGERTIVLLGHSLGSVIALDSLLTSEAWSRETDVVLITMGSPLRRFISRFFPDMVVPDDLNASARCIASRVRSFSWLNCYRPLDPIGSRLGLAADIGVEINTGQYTRIVSAHPNYWSDATVRDRLVRAYSGRPILAGASGDQPADALRPVFPHEAARVALARGTLLGLRCALVAAPLIALVFATLLTYASSREYRSDAALARSAGVPVEATFGHWLHVIHAPETAYSSEIDIREERLSWAYAVDGQLVSRKRSIGVAPFDRLSYLVDVECVVDLVHQRCAARDSEWCFQSSVEARALPDDPETFVVPQCPARRGLIAAVMDWCSRFAGALFSLAIFVGLSLVTAVPYTVLLTGSPDLLKES